MRILISEDDFTTRSVLTAALEKQGHEVVATVNGRDALKAMEQPDAPRMVILDWIMPEMDGIEVVRRVRETESLMPPYIIMLTTRGDKADIVAGLAAGADDYLTKPFDFAELQARIEVGRRLIEMQERLAAQIVELREALAHIKTLQGILPICLFCKKIRDDQGYWNKVEAYVSNHSNARFSHSVCPECMKKQYPEIDENDDY